MKLIKFLLATVTGLVALLLLVPTIVFGILHYWILTPEYLTSTAQNAVKEYTYIDFDCKKIELDYLNTWPYISLAIHEGKIQIPDQKDSIYSKGSITFHKLYSNIKLSKLLTDRSLQVENIFIENPQVEFFKGEKLPELLKNKKHTTNNNIVFNVNQINATDAAINIKHYLEKIDLEIKEASLDFKGNLIGQQPSFSVAIDCKEIGGQSITRQLGKSISFSMNGDCQGSNKFNDINFSNTSFYINQFPFLLNGSLYDINKNGELKTDLTFHLLASSLNDIADFIPDNLLPGKEQYTLNGNTMLEGSIKGLFNKSSLPDFKLKCMINNGSFYMKNIQEGIDTISLCMNFNYMKDNPDSCFISLKNTKIKGLNSHIEVESYISNLQQSPFITADLKGFIDFDYIGKQFISPSIMELKGKMESDFSVAFNLKDLKEQNIGRIWTNGTFNAPFVRAHSDKHHLDIFVAKTKATIGYKKNKSDFIKNKEVLSTNLEIDTCKIQYDKNVFINLSKLNLRSNTDLAKGKHTSTPVTVHVSCDKLQAQLKTEQWVYAKDLKVDAGSQSIVVTPKEEAACVVQAQEFQYIDKTKQNAIAMNDGKFIAELSPGKNNKWDFKGLMMFQDSKIYTSYYPIDIKAQKARIGFTNDQITVNHVQLNVGESDCILSGVLSTNDKSTNNPSKIEGTLHVLADYINYDELKSTLLYHEAAQKEFKVSNMQNFQINELNEIIRKVKMGKATSQPFYIPKNFDLVLNVNINQMNYEEVDLHQVNGNILIKEQKAYTSLSTRTNLGKINLQALYDSVDKKNIQMKFDLKLKDVLIAQIHQTIPTITTLFPMIKSMDGLINCHLTLSSQLDNQMMPVIETTEAICSINGQDMTLMDHEVFQNIAKKLKFKNKKKNKIDYLSADLILKNNQIEVIPFQLSWDRYEAIVGGTHTTDFTYNYHVSMLKSPIPFDLGVDLFGKTDEMHYKLAKCKYKDLYKDGGANHKHMTQERLNSKREAIIKNITL